MTALLIGAAAILLLVVNLVIHEAAHGLALRRLGGRVEEAGVGVPLSPRLTLAPTRRRPFRLVLTPWLFMAYVKPDEDSEKDVVRMSYWNRAWFYGAGVLANLLTGTLLLALITALAGRWERAALFAGIAAALWFGRKMVTWAMPLLALPATAIVVAGLVQGFNRHEGGGPIATYGFLATYAGDLLVLAAAIPLALAIFNLLPVFPFDGGRVMDAALSTVSSRAAAHFRIASGAAALLLVAYLVISDVVFAVI